jgi:hypothetical protein
VLQKTLILRGGLGYETDPQSVEEGLQKGLVPFGMLGFQFYFIVFFPVRIGACVHFKAKAPGSPV